MRPVSATFGDDAADAAEKHGAGFNVVAIDRAALEQHFGPSLRPAIALFEHYYDEADGAPNKKRAHSGGDAADSGAAAKRAKK